MTDLVTLDTEGRKQLVRCPGVDDNSMETLVTTVGTTPVQIAVPEALEVIITHQIEDGIIYVGAEGEVSADGSSLRLEEDSVLILEGSKEQNIWAVTATGTVDVLAIAGTKE